MSARAEMPAPRPLHACNESTSRGDKPYNIFTHMMSAFSFSPSCGEGRSTSRTLRTVVSLVPLLASSCYSRLLQHKRRKNALPYNLLVLRYLAGVLPSFLPNPSPTKQRVVRPQVPKWHPPCMILPNDDEARRRIRGIENLVQWVLAGSDGAEWALLMCAPGEEEDINQAQGEDAKPGTMAM